MPLTDTKLRAVRPTGVRVDLPDRGGLSMRVGTAGSMTWCLTYTVRGSSEAVGVRVARRTSNRRRAILGSYPAVSLSEAREAAQAMLRLAHAGMDPRPAQGPPMIAPVVLPMTVRELLVRYISDHLDRNLDSGGNVARLLRRHVEPCWGDRALTGMTPADLIELLERVRLPAGALVTASGHERGYAAVRGGPGAAVEVRKWVRAMFQYGAASGMLPANPFRDVRNRDRQRPRDRVLGMEEVAAVWRAAGRMFFPWSALFRLLLLTGDRRSEWAEAQASWLDAGMTRLEIPAEAYKSGRVHVVPFGTQVRAIVRGLPPPGFGPYLLSSTGGMQPVSGFSKAKALLDQYVLEEMGERRMAPWVLHDLRRSMATHMERLGVTPHIVEACLGHALKGVAGTYRHYGYLEEKRAALQLWADEVDAHVYPVQVAAE